MHILWDILHISGLRLKWWCLSCYFPVHFIMFVWTTPYFYVELALINALHSFDAKCVKKVLCVDWFWSITCCIPKTWLSPTKSKNQRLWMHAINTMQDPKMHFTDVKCCPLLTWRSFITMTSQWARWRLKLPASPLFTQPLFGRTSKKTSKRSASLAFARRIHRGPVNSPHKWPVTRERFPLDDVIILCHSFVYKAPMLLKPFWTPTKQSSHGGSYTITE